MVATFKVSILNECACVCDIIFQLCVLFLHVHVHVHLGLLLQAMQMSSRDNKLSDLVKYALRIKFGGPTINTLWNTFVRPTYNYNYEAQYSNTNLCISCMEG